MVPILFAVEETDFSHNGKGRLVEAMSCLVTDEINGIYELEMTYPVNGRLYSDLLAGGIIGATHDDDQDVQPFEIYKISVPIDGIVTVNAHHIGYRLNDYAVTGFTASSAAGAVAGLAANAQPAIPFTVDTTVVSTESYGFAGLKTARDVLMGEGGIVETYGGDVVFDKFRVSLVPDRGRDNGATVRYGKNMTAIEWERDMSGTFSAVAPFWSGTGGTVTLPEVYVQPTPAVLPLRVGVVDFTQFIPNKPTVAALRAAAQQWLTDNQPWAGTSTIRVNYAALWQSPEYAALLDVQRVAVGDYVSAYWPEAGIVAQQTRVNRVVYDALLDRVEEIELGSIVREYVAISGGGGGGGAAGGAGVRRVLLWTNPDPTVNFAAQTIPVDVSTYRSVMVFYNYSATSARSQSEEILASVGAGILTFVGITGTARGGRAITITASGIDVDDAHAASSTVANQYAIPTEIYGVNF